jgi:BTB/POZ domain
MISSDFQEKSEHQAKLKEFTPESFLDFLHFLYTDSVKDIKNHVIELLEMSHLYQVEGLRVICEKTLMSGLNEENAADIFQYSHLYECDTSLKKSAFAIIKR